MSTAAVPGASLTRTQLAERLRRVDPSAVLVPPHILRRVIRRHRALPGVALFVPHRQCYLIRRETLLLFVSPQELGVASAAALADRVLLLAEPSPRQALLAPGALLRDYWRLLFHGEIHRRIAVRRAAGSLPPGLLPDQLGVVEFAEITAVLAQERLLFTTADPAEVHEEFAAFYLELRHFEPARLHYCFPGLGNLAAVDALLGEEVDAAAILARTRPEGSDAAIPRPAADEEETAVERGPATVCRDAELPPEVADVARRGNQVRAAIRYQRAAASSAAGDALRAAAGREVNRLAERLAAALGQPAGAAWDRALAPLLEPAACGLWTREGRLLYDLQKVCLDHERPVYAADLVEWLVSGFARPIQRPLPDLPLVRAVKHLRKAQSRLPYLRITDAARRRLAQALDAALRESIRRLRDTLRPRLVASLEAVGLAPRVAAEQLARDQLVEELLDRVVERGHLRLPDLRDAVARNRLKLPDLSGPGEFFLGDPLIRANRLLAAQLDGVYRRGEIYLRWLQRLSSLFFGNHLGRALTLFAVLPLLGSFFLLKGIDGLAEELHKYAGTAAVETFSPLTFSVLALLLVPLVNAPAFRQQLGRGLRLLWQGVRGVLYDLPAALLHSPPVQRLLHHPTTQALLRYVGKPFLWTLPVFLLLQWLEVGAGWSYGLSAVQLVLAAVLLNTPLGIHVEESVVLSVVHAWTMIHEDLLPGLFRSILWLSRRSVERVEQVLYTVDEWLRFRHGETRAMFVVKLTLGTVWFVITYVVRFVFVLLIEPQVNPIKHFPVVTVSHKLMLLLGPPLADVLAPELGMSYKETLGLVVLVLGLIPGVFGFLAWELKENWKLYRANQAPDLKPRTVGSHGERVIHLIRPGFHSGTLPRLYKRLRHEGDEAERRDEVGLHHVEADLRRFVERDLLAPLALSTRWDDLPRPVVGPILLATNRIEIELRSPAAPAEPVRLEFANRDRRLVARLRATGWVARLAPAARGVFEAALTAFYKQAGVDVVLEQVAALLPPEARIRLHDDHFTVSLPGPSNRVVDYSLTEPDERPLLPAGVDLPATATAFLFCRQPVAWTAWVAYWEADQAGLMPEPLLPSMPSLLREDCR